MLFFAALGAITLSAASCDPQSQAPALAGTTAPGSVRIAHISDTHVGEPRSPNAVANLRAIAQLVSQQKPDAVILSGDIAQHPAGWSTVRNILASIQAPVYYVPGNHDAHPHNLAEYRRVFGDDYYRFQVGHVTFLALNSQIMGNFADFETMRPQPMPPAGEAALQKMLQWMEQQAQVAGDGPIVVVQHVPHFREAGVLPDTRPYWVTQEPYRTRVLETKRKLGIRHVFAGHWHRAHTFQRGGITYHLAPSTSWLPWGGRLGFSMHTISPTGQVQTQHVFPERMTPGR